MKEIQTLIHSKSNQLIRLKKVLIVMFMIAIPDCLFSQKIPYYMPKTGLLAWYPFSGTTLDESGNANHGTNNGATLTQDRFGTTNAAYSFNGSSDISSSINLPSRITSYTISCWFKVINTSAGGFIGIGGPSTSSLYGLTARTIGSNTVYGSHWVSDGVIVPVFAETYSSFSVNAWQHAVLSYDSSFSKLYMNGQLVDSAAAQMTIPNVSSFNCFIGSILPWRSKREYFNGLLDDIAFYERALTGKEIFQLYNNCATPVITSQPQNQLVDLGLNATFNIQTASTPFSYQWQLDSGTGFKNLIDAGQYSGTGTATLKITNVQLNNDQHLFRCILKDGSCEDTSGSAKLALKNTTSSWGETLSSGVTFFPNPTSCEGLHIKVNELLIGSSFHICDALGNEIFSGNIANTETWIDLKDFEKGLFIVTISDKTPIVFRFIKV